MDIRALLLEDVPDDAELLARELRKADPGVAVQRVADRAEFERALRDFAPNVVISDHSLPRFSGRDALELVLQAAPALPFILVTGSMSEETAVEYMKAGAADYLLKDRVTRLGPAVLAALEQRRVREHEERARVAAEEALRTQRAFLRAVVDLCPNLIFVKDWDGRFVLVNQAGAEIYGTTGEAIVGKTDADFNPHTAEVEHFLRDDRAVMEGGQPLVIPEESVTDTRTGKLRWFQTIKVPLRWPSHDRPLVLGVAMDITDRRRLEEQLRLAQRMEAVGTLAGGVAHDFNNLLATIKTTVELVLQDLPADAPVRGELAEVLEHADRAAALTRQLLAFGRKQVLEPRIVDLNALVASVVKMLKRIIGADVALVLQQTPLHVTVSADPGQVEQVLMNLCVNARDAMPQGGELAILTERVSLDEAFGATHPWARPGEYVRLTVSDTGMGMDAGTQAHSTRTCSCRSAVRPRARSSASCVRRTSSATSSSRWMMYTSWPAAPSTGEFVGRQWRCSSPPPSDSGRGTAYMAMVSGTRFSRTRSNEARRWGAPEAAGSTGWSGKTSNSRRPTIAPRSLRVAWR